MALQKQTATIPFALGLDTKRDEKQQIIGRLITVENAIYTKLDQLKKRNGYDDVSLDTIDSSVITNAQKLTKFKNELNLFDLTRFYSFSDSIEKWVEKGKTSSIFPSSNPIIRNSSQQDQYDALEIEDIEIYAWHDSGGGVKYSAVDTEKKNFLISNDEISSSGTNPRVCRIENFVFIFFTDGTDLKYRRFNIFNPGTLETEVTVQSNVDGAADRYDAVSVSNRIAVAYNSSDGAAKLKAFTIDETETLSSVISLTGEDASSCINISPDPESRLIITYADASDIKAVIFPLNLLSTLVAPTVIESIAGVTNTTSIIQDDDSYLILYEISAAATSNHLVKKCSIDLSATVGAISVFSRGTGLSSKLFSEGGDNYVSTLHSSPLQATYFLMDDTGSVVARLNPGVGGSLITNGMLPQVSNLGDNKHLFANQIKGRNVSENNTFFSLLGINSTTFDFNIATPFQSNELGDTLHISGGILQMYDGDMVVEHGFHLFPETLIDGGTATTGGFISDGTYQYVAVYAWTDNAGQLHRSAPSIALTVVLSGGTGTQTQTITIPTLRLTEKVDVIVELYRTEDVGTIFHKISEVSSPSLNDPTVDTIDIVDDVDDTSLLSNQLLYTTGGVLDNIVAPSSALISSWQNRIMLSGLEDDNAIAFSKIRFEGEPVEFNDILRIQVPNVGGKITATAVMDEKYIIFKEDGIFYLAGGGPNNLGEQDTFIDPEQIATDVGCVDPNSVVLSPLGLFFKSKKGVYLLSRSLQTAYIGEPIDKFNNLTITSGKG